MTDVKTLLEQLLEDPELDAALREQLEATDAAELDLAVARVDEGLAALDDIPAPEALLAKTMARIDADGTPRNGVFGALVLGLGSGLAGLASGLASLGRAIARASKSSRRATWIAAGASAMGALVVCGTLLSRGADEVVAVASLTRNQPSEPASLAAEHAAGPALRLAEPADPELSGASEDDGYFGGGLNLRAQSGRLGGGGGDFHLEDVLDEGGRFQQGLDSDGDLLGDDGIIDAPPMTRETSPAFARDRVRLPEGEEQEGLEGWAGQNAEHGGEGQQQEGQQPSRFPRPPADRRAFATELDWNEDDGRTDRGELTEGDGSEGERFGTLDLEQEAAEPPDEVTSANGLRESTIEGRRRTAEATRPGDVVDEALLAARFLAERDVVDGLRFQPARGIWANTYVPGDPAWRLLGRRLRAASGSPIPGLSESPLQLAEHAQPLAQRVSAPRSGALTLAVQADRASVEGRSRVLLQVALRGAAVRAGRRPTLRSMVVLDLRRPLDDDGRAKVRTLLSSLSRARTGADRIGLVVAGPQGGVVIEPGQLRLGRVTVALRRVFRGEHSGSETSLAEALATAIERVGQLGDADSPLGSGLVWLVTPGVSEADARALEPTAHAGSLAGVTTTGVGLPGAALDPLETVALAGQGRRWTLDDDTDGLVRREVQAVSRVVARAVRLNVRLAPGVHLVDVLGSRPLAEMEARSVREAERALDQRLARRLGILSDREEDDDGVQIVVPAFYADDTHVLLLDLVVDGPGPVADVTAKFKDLLRLTNGEATERVVLGRGRARRGPQEREVLRNLLAFELSVALRRVAREVQVDRARATATIREARARILAARREIGALASDRDLASQLEACRAFEAALTAGAPAPLLADSLRYASRRLLFGDPLEVEP